MLGFLIVSFTILETHSLWSEIPLIHRERERNYETTNTLVIKIAVYFNILIMLFFVVIWDNERGVYVCVCVTCWEQVLNGKKLSFWFRLTRQSNIFRLFLAGKWARFFLAPLLSSSSCCFQRISNIFIYSVEKKSNWARLIHLTRKNGNTATATQNSATARLICSRYLKHFKAKRGFSTISNTCNVCFEHFEHLLFFFRVQCTLNVLEIVLCSSKCMCHAFVCRSFVLLCTHTYFITRLIRLMRALCVWECVCLFLDDSCS